MWEVYAQDISVRHCLKTFTNFFKSLFKTWKFIHVMIIYWRYFISIFYLHMDVYTSGLMRVCKHNIKCSLESVFVCNYKYRSARAKEFLSDSVSTTIVFLMRKRQSLSQSLHELPHLVCLHFTGNLKRNNETGYLLQPYLWLHM